MAPPFLTARGALRLRGEDANRTVNEHEKGNRCRWRGERPIGWTSPMIWSFSRGSAQVDIEVRRVGEPAVFELVVDYPDGSEEVRRFTEPRKLVRQTLSLQRRLIRQGWVPPATDLRQPK